MGTKKPIHYLLYAGLLSAICACTSPVQTGMQSQMKASLPVAAEIIFSN